MSANLRLESLGSRMAVFAWLSKALDYPGEELAQTLAKGGLVENLTGDLWDELREYIKSFKSAEELLLDLQKDYTRLCYVSKPRLVPLFESVYKEGKLYQDSTFDIARLYDEAGLRPEEEFNLPPDHITLELEFMSYLIYQEIEAIKNRHEENEQLALRLQSETIKNHLGVFGLGFADKLEQHCRSPFYKSAAGILRDFIEYELQHYVN
jgi:TorA maturation chaperone TorD